MGMKSRLERLERRTGDPGPEQAQLPPDFWRVLADLTLLKSAHPDTRRLIESMIRTDPRDPDEPDPIEEEIAARLRVGAITTGRTNDS
jgi:hypothetical protein